MFGFVDFEFSHTLNVYKDGKNNLSPKVLYAVAHLI